MQVRAFCSDNELSSSKIACNSPPAALKYSNAKKFNPVWFEVRVCFLHLKNKNKLAAGLVNSVKLHNLFGVCAQHQHGDLMLDLFEPTGGSTSTPQKLCCILDARCFVRRAANRSEVSSAKKKKTKNVEIILWFKTKYCLQHQQTSAAPTS
jgi:hypothetical protein